MVFRHETWAIVRRMPPNLPDADRHIAVVAKTQRRLITYRQLKALGVSEASIARRVDAGRLIRVLRGVYAVGVGLIDQPTFLMAAQLAAGDGAALVDHSAAGVLGIADHASGVVFVGRPCHEGNRRVRTEVRLADGKYGFVQVRHARHLETDVVKVDNDRTTNVERTLVDLASLSQRLLDQAWREADFRSAINFARLDAILDGNRRASGIRTVREKRERHIELARGRRGIDSIAELEMVQALIRAGVPPPLVNYPIKVCGRIRYPDLYWPHARLIVEIDGGAAHRVDDAVEDDPVRDSDFLTIGILTLRFTARKAQREPAWCTERILGMIRERTESTHG